MKLSQLKKHLENSKQFSFQLPNGEMVPEHFHITEMGLITKHFIDCGISIHQDKKISFQVWYANDLEHKLTSDVVLKIISASDKIIENQDLEIEVEYQMEETIGKFGLDYANGNFQLTKKETACLAIDSCGIPKEKLKLSELVTENSCCTPKSNYC